MRPRVVIHNAASVNGELSGYEIDLDLHYRLAGRLACDATLVGSRTILASPEGACVDDPSETVEGAPSDAGSVLVVADSKGRVRCWSALQSAGLWKRFVSIAAAVTPAEHLEYLRGRGVGVIVAGEEHVDFTEALARLGAAWGVTAVRVDSGGMLNGILVRDGLVDELSVVLQPALTFGDDPVPLVRPAPGIDPRVRLSLRDVERFDGGEVWLHYDVVR
jgi:2,5-diamino-6-(ribosylamino)-4(3H)-pyrimidinone 5'-phosphate reductase